MRRLRVVPVGDGGADADAAEPLRVALREALSGGPAILPLPAARACGSTASVPVEVSQRVALVVETSGSSGAPKRVALSADAVLANAGASEAALGGPAQWVLALPTHYIAGLNVLIRSIAAGTEPESVRGEHFTAAGFTAAARRLELPERCTALVPAQLATLLEDAEARAELRRFQAVLVGGQSTPATLLTRATDAGIRVVRSYGASETSGGCVYDGRPIGTADAAIVDGELWLGGPSIAEGYLGDPELTADRFVDGPVDGSRHGAVRWFRTADAGSFAGDLLVVTGRRDDVIVSGGVKVSLGAVERMLREHAGLHDAVVVGAPHPRWGEAPVVVVSADAGGSADPALASAIEAVGTALGPAARPDRIIRVSALPMLASGKVDRPALRRRAAAATGSDPPAS